MFMRLCTPVPLCLAAAAVLLSVPSAAYAAPGPSCAGADAGDFPLTSRLHGGPDSYRAGGGYGTWYLDLTNTTRRTCTGVHPVVVLVDAERALEPSQPRLEFYADGAPHPVRFETTDEDELVGALMDQPAGRGEEPAPGPTPFPGFTVAPGKTLTVKLRLALTSDAVRNEVTANAAVVQRHGDDGEWIGQSNDYRFTVEGERRAAAPETTAPGTSASGTSSSGSRDPHATSPDATSPNASASHASASARASAGPAATDSAAAEPDASASPSAGGLPSFADEAEELALTGLSSPAVLAVTVCLIALGAALVQARRRR
ncbi:hypothetical protein [Streptomyces sp. NPDC002328]|uniref:hypothetical protein n=1 Tax=Streptomyces sp. NPDC002328 TaxID=3364642 RepID=UPI00369F655C